MLNELTMKLQASADYEYLSVEEFAPVNSSSKYKYTQCMKNHGFPVPTALVTYTHGNNLGNLNFIWKVPFCDESGFSASQSVILKLQENIPTFHTRAMKKQMFERFDHLMPGVKPAILRHVYKALTGKLLHMHVNVMCNCLKLHVHTRLYV